MDYITPKQAAGLWGISERRVEALCANGRIDGAERLGGKMWVIPKSATKPMDGRTKTAKLQTKPLEYALTLETDRVIEMVNGTMAIEGMPLTDEDRGRLRIIMRREATADEIVRQLIVKHGGNANAKRLRV